MHEEEITTIEAWEHPTGCILCRRRSWSMTQLPVRLLHVGPDHVRRCSAQEPCGPDDASVKELMSGNICRCGAYQNIVAAIQQKSAKLTGEGDLDAQL